MRQLTKKHSELLVQILRGVMNEGYMQEETRNKYLDLVERIQNTYP